MIYDLLRHTLSSVVLPDHMRMRIKPWGIRAKHVLNVSLWQAVQEWLTRHNARLVSELPSVLLDRLDAGDFLTKRYQHVIVDEFQDLTAVSNASLPHSPPRRLIGLSVIRGNRFTCSRQRT